MHSSDPIANTLTARERSTAAGKSFWTICRPRAWIGAHSLPWGLHGDERGTLNLMRAHHPACKLRGDGRLPSS